MEFRVLAIIALLIPLFPLKERLKRILMKTGFIDKFIFFRENNNGQIKRT